MKYLIEVNVSTEGKTVVKIHAEAVREDVTVAVGDSRAPSVSRAVDLAMEPLWDGLVQTVVADARGEVSEARWARELIRANPIAPSILPADEPTEPREA